MSLQADNQVSYVCPLEFRNPNFCPICLENFDNGCIKNNKFNKPDKWNFDILNCGHILCQNCMNIYFEKEKKCPFRCTNLSQYTFGDNQNSWLTVKQGIKQWNIDIVCKNPSTLIRGKNLIGLFNCILHNSYLTIIKNKENNLLINKKMNKLENHFKKVLLINQKKMIVNWKKSHRKTKTISKNQQNKIKRKVFADITQMKKI